MEYEHDHRIVLPDGTVKHIHAIGHPVLDENGKVAEYVGTAMDVTERKLAEDELRKHREQPRRDGEAPNPSNWLKPRPGPKPPIARRASSWPT